MVNPRRRVITGSGYRVGGGRADRIATSGRAAPSERFLAGKGELCVVGGLGIFAVLAAIKANYALLRKPAFIAFYAAPCSPAKCGCGHQHLPTQNNCIAATTGARDS